MRSTNSFGSTSSITPPPPGRSNNPCRGLYNACAKGDWEAARCCSQINAVPWTSQIDDDFGTALHIAAMAGQTNFIRNLVQEMSSEDLKIQDKSGFTALHNIATNGNIDAAEILLQKNPGLTLIRNIYGETPLVRAALFGHEKIFRNLYKQTQKEVGKPPIETSPFTGEEGASLLVTLIDANLFDVALDFVTEYETIAITKARGGRSAIEALATKSWQNTLSQEDRKSCMRGYTNSMLGTLERVFPDALKHLVSIIKINDTNKKMYTQYLSLVQCICDKMEQLSNDSNTILDGTVLKASEHGNVDFIELIVNIDQKQLTIRDASCLSMLHNAIKHRQKEVFYYLKESGFKDELALRKGDTTNETILHLAAKMSPPHKLEEISGAALQVQHEIQWYKEVEKIVQPFYRDMKNSDGMRAREMFTMQHKALVSKGEEWMKHMASHSMLVGTLIATVVFTAAFTVPGGNNQERGMPIFLSRTAYMVFAVSNALAFFSSLTSVLTFLSILTARYAEEDFLRSLPQRLIIGLAMLFFAIATMVMAFISTYFLMLGHKRAWISILLAVLTCVPVTLFGCLQFRLFVEMFKSTYKSIL